MAILPGESGQAIPVVEFLMAAFDGRLKFGIPIGSTGHVTIHAGTMSCWKCGADTSIVTGIYLAVGPHHFSFSVPDLTDHPELCAEIKRRLPKDSPASGLSSRYSKTQGRSYFSNGCLHCAALIGQFHEYEAFDSQQVTQQFVVDVDDQWLRAIGDEYGEVSSWVVFQQIDDVS
jgi:competence protein CoiA